MTAAFQMKSQTSASKRTTENGNEPKSMDKLDGPFGWPIVGNFLTYLKKENQGKMHEVQARQHKMYGKIFREKWGPQWQVHVSDPRLIEEVYRHEGRHPFRPPLQAWVLYREVTGRPTGLVTSQGNEWYKYRTELGKRMLSAKAVSRLLEPVNDVSSDLIVKLRSVRDTEGDISLAKRLPREIYNWSMEAAGTFLFETRFGCLEPVVPERTRKFIAALQEMLESSLYLIVGERFHQRLNTPFWRRHAAAWGQLFDIAKELVDHREKELMANGSSNVSEEDDKSNGVYLTYLLSNKNLTRDEIYSNLMEMLIAGTDTTANSFCFIVHLLAANPEAQERLYAEVCDVVQGRRDVTAADLDRMQYVKCVIKEGLRLYPSATMNCRILSEDIILGEHLIPKNTLFVLNHYASARDKDVFAEADRFLPERWLRGTTSATVDAPTSTPASPPSAETDSLKQHHAFGCLPFGYGNRSCLGRRAANLELAVVLTKIVQNFKIEVQPDIKFNPVLRTLLTPGDQVPVRFVERTSSPNVATTFSRRQRHCRETCCR